MSKNYPVICNCLIGSNINKISLPENSREILFN